MAVSGHLFPSWNLAVAKKQVNVTTDTLQVLLVASGTYTWNSAALAAVHVSDFLAGSGGGALTEVATGVGTNYTRQTLATVAVADSSSVPNGWTTVTVSGNPTWTSCTFTCSYALAFDNTVGGTDSTNQVLGYFDFGVAQAVTPAADFVMNLGSLNGVSQALMQWQTS